MLSDLGEVVDKLADQKDLANKILAEHGARLEEHQRKKPKK